MKIIKKEPGKDYEIIETNITSQYEIKSLLDGFPELVYITNDLKYIIDENGVSKRLPLNFCIKTTSRNYPVVKLLGTVFLIRTKSVYKYGECYERIVDLKPKDIELFEKTLALSEELPIPYYLGYEKY